MANNNSGPTQFHPLPTVGSIVWVKFPHAVGQPGPYARPAIVKEVSPQYHRVKVVFGTSKKTEKLYPTEFVIKKTDPDYLQTGLSYDTKFDVSRVANIPYDDDWFDIPKSRKGKPPFASPVIGILPASYIPAIQLAVSNIK
ncbi:hypothetical protein J3D56_002115 [Erwinia persicina]|uniref:hypothetical protein n=1 Tax=Erwinia persicina TaxID=55211 RepID=UPI0020A1ECB0|nr:hypothetical protein [Erwinia persicina]MCP1438679.1 hypothetical protein [Erwinia persicina]